MRKIVGIIGVAMFLLTVSSAVWAGVDGPGGGPTPKPTPTTTVTAPRTSPSPIKASYKYHNDDYYARHPNARIQRPADFGMVSVFRLSETTSVATPTATPTAIPMPTLPAGPFNYKTVPINGFDLGLLIQYKGKPISADCYYELDRSNPHVDNPAQMGARLLPAICPISGGIDWKATNFIQAQIVGLTTGVFWAPTATPTQTSTAAPTTTPQAHRAIPK